MKPCYLIIWLICCFYPCSNWAQSGQARYDFIEYSTENDYYYLRLPSDRYYTAGQTINWQDQRLDKGRLGPGQLFPLRLTGRAAGNISQLRLRYQLFSPFRIHWEQAREIDRPYAARMDLQLKNQTILADHELKIKKAVLLGWQGPSLQGERIQNGIHRLKGRPLAQGWQFQLADRPYWAAQLQVEKALFSRNQHLLTSQPEIYWGNVQQYAQIGLHYKYGDLEGYFQPGRKMPDIFWHAYFHLNTRYVQRNELLNGPMRPSEGLGAFQSPILVPVVWRASYGIEFTRKRWAVRLSQEALSPEFEHGSSHYWGSISLRKYY